MNALTDRYDPTLLSGIISIAADAIVSINEDHRIILFNEGAERTFGYRAEEVMGRPLDLLLPDRFRANHGEDIRRFAASKEVARRMGERGEIRGLRKDGQEFPAEATISKLEARGEHIFTVMLRDITERNRREARIRFLARELDHRARNLLACFRAIVALTRDSEGSVGGFRERLLARIDSLTRAHAQLGRHEWQGVSVQSLVADQLEAYATDRNVRLEGPAIEISGRAAQPLAIVIHELATNAVKHGSLSVPEGRVTVSWRREAMRAGGEALALEWREEGGPEVRQPERVGYGMHVIRGLLAHECGGTVEVAFLPTGLTCRISLPLAR
jgi:PAS domain S-box-containing protein